MGMNRKYSGFTLVEMLIVMGIIIILMAVGIAAGRFAINRAGDVAHQSAADQLFVAVQSYFTDEREYPVITDWTQSLGCENDTGVPCLGEYLSLGEFRGGSDATYYYWTNDIQTVALVCVSLGGQNDVQKRGFYCTGNGFGTEAPGGLDTKEVEANDTEFPAGEVGDWTYIAQWNNTNEAFD